MEFRSAIRILGIFSVFFLILKIFPVRSFASTPIFFDDFTGVNGTELSVHNPKLIHYINDTCIIDNNQAYTNTPNDCNYYVSKDVKDARISLDFMVDLSHSSFPGAFAEVFLRETDPPNGYGAEAYIWVYPDGSGKIEEVTLWPTTYSHSFPAGTFSYGQKVNLFLQYKDDLLTTGIDGKTYLTQVDTAQTHGTFGFAVSSTHIDNLVVSSVDPDALNVPYFSQNAQPWGQTEYDDAKSLGFTSLTMDRWGCAVTSAAMVLNYHKITKLPNGTSLDPGSLNTWLKNNHGYLEGNGPGGSYSYILWPAIASLSKKVYDAGKSDTELMFQQLYRKSSTDSTLETDVTSDIPDILGVSNAQTTQHFVVAKGKNSNTYLINDPEWSYPDLTSFGNTYSQVERFIPSHTDLSYIVAVTNPDIEVSIASASGKTGAEVDKNGKETFDQITNATYHYEPPISNPDESGDPQSLGTGVNALYIPLPADGTYTITVSGDKNAFYTLNLATFETDGTQTTDTIQGTVDPNNPDTFTLTYTTTGNPTTTQTVTFDSMLADITQLQKLGYLNKNIAKTLTKSVKAIAKSAAKKKTQKTVPIKLTAFETILSVIKKATPQFITQFAYQELYQDAEVLKTSQ